MRTIPRLALLACLLAAPTSIWGGEEARSAQEPQFALKAALERQRVALHSSRFVLEPSLSRREAAPTAGASGIRLRASLVPQGAPDCVVTERIFGDGFESP